LYEQLWHGQCMRDVEKEFLCGHLWLPSGMWWDKLLMLIHWGFITLKVTAG
jgi:hypothetical protein